MSLFGHPSQVSRQAQLNSNLQLLMSSFGQDSIRLNEALMDQSTDHFPRVPHQ